VAQRLERRRKDMIILMSLVRIPLRNVAIKVLCCTRSGAKRRFKFAALSPVIAIAPGC
jgi:hypothetical protein